MFRERLTFFTVVGLSATIQLSVCVLPGTKRQCTVEDTLIITGRGLHATSLSPAVSNVQHYEHLGWSLNCRLHSADAFV